MRGQQRRQPLDDGKAHGQADTELQQKAVHRVGRLGAIVEPRLAHAVQRRQRLQGLGLGGGAKRIVGRTAASQMASASMKSFLLPSTKGRTYCGEISLTSWPKEMSLRARRCARAGLHHGRAGVKLGNELDELLAVELPAEHRQPLAA